MWACLQTLKTDFKKNAKKRGNKPIIYSICQQGIENLSPFWIFGENKIVTHIAF